MNAKSLLNNRYEIKEVLGRGGFATTYLAVDTETQQKYAIKCLSFRKIKEWKTWELAEREARILKSLNHSQIPAYIDFFTVETEQDVEIYLVQGYVEGQSLAQVIQEGRHFTEEEVIRIGLSMAKILAYLHKFSPPIIHRDIKPNNIILTPDHQAYLVDFDTVSDKIRDEMPGMPTIVGTYGYMPIEQTEGRTVPASDIYSLGMTLIAMLARKEPSQIEKKGLHLDFRPHVNISHQVAAILEKMIEPDWHKRYQSALDLRGDLERLLSRKHPTKVTKSPFLRPAMLAVEVVLFLIVTGVGAGVYYWLQARTPLSPPPPEVVNQPVNAPYMPQKLPIPEEVVQPVNAPKLPPLKQEKFVYPQNGKISVDIYRDFTFKPIGWPFGLSVGQTVAGGLDTLPYERLIREPAYRSENVLYGYLLLGNGDDRQISFAIDEIERPNWVVYVDTNNNEDLTDDGGPQCNEGTGKMAAEVTVQVEIVTPMGEKLIQPYALWMWVNETQSRAWFYARCHYAGQFMLNGEIYDVVAFEQLHHDGLYRESGLWIDLNRDGNLNEGTEHFEHGIIIRVADKEYQLELLYP